MTLSLKLANNAAGIMAAGISPSATSITLTAGHGARFPAIVAGEDFFTITATTQAGDHEIMVVTARAFDVLTVIRGQENTLARTFAAGTIVENRLTAGTFLGELGRLQTLVNVAVTTFNPGPGVSLTTASVKAVLANALTTAEFSTGLAGTIAKIDGAVSSIGSVNQRIKVETDNRVASVQSAIDQAVGLVNAEVGQRNAAISNYGYNKVTVDNAIAFQASATQTAYTAYTDTAKTQAIALAAADVRQYAFSKSDSTTSLAQLSNTLTANYTAYADAKKGEAISAASADVRNYSYSQAQVNSALAAQATQLRSEFVSSNGVTEAYLSNFAYSKSQIDSSEAAQTTSITTAYQGYANTKKGEAISAAAADVRQYAYSQAAVDSAIASTNSAITTSYNNAVAAAASDVRGYTFSQSAINSALAAQSTSLTTNYQNYANARKGEAIAAAAADVRAYTYSQSTIDGSFSSQTTTLTANYKQYADAKKSEAIIAAAADVRNYTYAAATIDGAISSSINTVNARLNNAGGVGVTVESKLSASASAIGALQGQASLVVDVNGTVTGIRATGTSGGVSTIDFSAATFTFSAPGVAKRALFGPGVVNGQTRMAILGDAFVDGAVTARALRVGSFDNIVPDPQFKDLAWWRRTGTAIGDWSAGGTGWTLGYSMYIGPGVTDTATQSFPMTPGATYKVELQSNLSPDWNGYAGVYLEIAADHWDDMGQDNLYSWGNEPGTHIQYDPGSPQGRRTFTATVIVPDNGYTNRTSVRIRTQIASGTFEWGSLCVTRISDSTLIKDGAITTGKLTAECVTTDNLQANGVSELDSYYGSVAVFAAPRDFKCDLRVRTPNIYQEDGVTVFGHWILERYTDQGSGIGYWSTIIEVTAEFYAEILNLEKSSATYPYYRVRLISGNGMSVKILKVFK